MCSGLVDWNQDLMKFKGKGYLFLVLFHARKVNSTIKEFAIDKKVSTSNKVTNIF